MLSRPLSHSPPPSSPALAAGAYALFFASGAVGLVYEVLWLRRFAVLFGGTAPAGAATLAGFFLGLAAGSAVFGRRSSRFSRPLAAFGLLELGVAAGALTLLAVLDLYGTIYPLLHQAFASRSVPILAVKLGLALFAAGIPAFFMGGTLPVLAEAFVPASGGLGRPVGGLYAANLLGAVVGSLAVPFLLLPRLGASGAYAAAVLASLGIGLTAVGLARGRVPRALPLARSAKVGAGAVGSVGTPVLLLSALSGAATLGLQVLWLRAFALVHESSLHAFAVVLSVFLVGLAGGTGLARLGLREGRAAARLLGLAWVGGGLLAVLAPLAFMRLTGGLDYVQGSSWLALQARLAGLALLVVGPVTFALGAALPLLLEQAGRREAAAGPATGAVVAANTVGAIIGPLAATFLLAPALGLWRSMAAFGMLLVLAGAWAGLAWRQRAAAAALAAAAVLLLESGALPAVRVRRERGERLLSAREGAYGTTAVIEDEHDRWITVNNSYVLGGTAAAAEERWQAHLPLLLHAAPRRIAFVGLGTGISAGAALAHPVERVVAFELVPEVVAAARDEFGGANRSLLADSRVTIEVDDGRHALAAGAGPFDVVVGDLVVPWRPGEASLFAREHFGAVRRALAPDGLFCQWLPVYQLSEPALRGIMAGFVDVFPRTTVWRGNLLAEQPILALVGQRDARPLDAGSVDTRLRSLPPSLVASEPFLRHPAGFWLFLVGPLSPSSVWLKGAQRHTDAWPWLEILGPRALAEGEPARFAREQLPERLATLYRESFDGTPLAGLGEERLAWRATGSALVAASSLGASRGEAEALRLLHGLPLELQEALGLPRR